MRGSRLTTAERTPPRAQPDRALLDVVYIIGRYPLLTTTFIDREIQALQRAGVTMQVISIRRPAQLPSQPQAALEDGVHYLLPVGLGELVGSHLAFLFSRPATYLRTLFFLFSRRHPSPRARLWTLFHFAEAVPVARLLRDKYPSKRVHAHFVDRAALIALVAARFLGIPYSATAHANDIYVDPVLLPEKLAEAAFVVTCTHYNRSHLLTTAANPVGPEVLCIHHGVDVEQYHPPSRRERRARRPLLLAVAQLQEKKGLAHLIDACRLLRERGFDFECEIVGDGPLRPALRSAIEASSLGTVVRLVGALAHDAVIERYGAADIFVLPCTTATNGGRDGIPNVILEAMAMGLPVVSTRHSGVPEAVEEGQGGLLVPPGDALALADALAELIEDEELRYRFGSHGRRVVEVRFDSEANTRRLLDHLTA